MSAPRCSRRLLRSLLVGGPGLASSRVAASRACSSSSSASGPRSPSSSSSSSPPDDRTTSSSRASSSRASSAARPPQPPSSSSSSSSAPRYPGHRPLSPAQSALLTVAAGVGALVFPERADLVGAVGETTGGFYLRRVRDRMRSDPVGRSILDRAPRITDATLERAWGEPPGTFGREWAEFMGTRRFNPRDRPPVRFVDDPELAYVATRQREVHDLWHVLFACPTTVQGELALKALEFVQTGSPMNLLSAAMAPARLPATQRRQLRRLYYPWAWRAGNRAADLMCLDYEAELGTDLEELRMKWRISPAPAAAE